METVQGRQYIGSIQPMTRRRQKKPGSACNLQLTTRTSCGRLKHVCFRDSTLAVLNTGTIVTAATKAQVMRREIRARHLEDRRCYQCAMRDDLEAENIDDSTTLFFDYCGGANPSRADEEHLPCVRMLIGLLGSTGLILSAPTSRPCMPCPLPFLVQQSRAKLRQ